MRTITNIDVAATAILAALSLTAFGTGCAVDAGSRGTGAGGADLPAQGEESGDPAVGTDVEAIQQAPTTRSFAGNVEISFGPSVCSATMLSEHWLLTAAHCSPGGDGMGQIWYAPGVDGKRVEVYPEAPNGFVPIRVFPHPSYSGDAPYDIALVQILDYGMDLSSIGRAKIDTGNTTPGSGGNPSYAFTSGFGWGEDPSASAGCEGTAGVTVDVLRWQTENVYSDSSTVIAGDTKHCHGDSGGPWMYGFSGTYLQFAVTHGYSWYFWHGYRDQGALIAPARAWMESVMGSNMPYLFEDWPSDGSASGHSYRSYYELNAHTSTISIGSAHWCLTPTAAPGWGAAVVLQPCDPTSTAQKWTFGATGEIRNVAYPGSCLDAQGGHSDDGTVMQLYPCNTTASQRFRYDSDWSIHLGLDLGQCIDVSGGNMYAGAKVQAWDCNGTAAQTWRMWQ